MTASAGDFETPVRIMLTDLRFDNRFVNELPGDPEHRNFVRQVPNACYSFVEPRSVSQPKLIAYSSSVAELLGFSEKDCSSEDFVQVFAGNRRMSGMKPYSMCYGGHQFGNWAGQLGDGRAITLGDAIGIDGNRYSLQLKGAGLTPYSRSADGLAVLRSSLREFVCSEAMYHLGVPTTRALSLVSTGEEVVRDMLYDGNPAPEPGAVVCRVAPTFVRFGNFEILTAQRNFEVVRQLIDHTIKSDFKHLSNIDITSTYVEWFEEIVNRTAYMVSEWIRVGFVHGVMNTDNMSITGLTIDYGPYGWLEDFDPNWTPNTTDAGTRRYRFGQQPAIAQWNLLQLANAIAPVVQEVKPLEHALNEYPQLFARYYSQSLGHKLGLNDVTEGDSAFFQELEQILMSTETDMTLFYRLLTKIDLEATAASTAGVEQLVDAYYHPEELTGATADRINAWLSTYAGRVLREAQDSDQRIATMNSVNPLYVPRNYLAQLAIDDAEKGDYAFLHDWIEVLENPYVQQDGKEKFAEKRPDWARTRVGCSMLSCSS